MNTENMTIEELGKDLRAAAQAWADGRTSGVSADALTVLKKAASKACDAYNDGIARDAYEAWSHLPNPVEEMLRTYYIKGTMKVSVKKYKDSGMYGWELTPTKTKVSLVQYAIKYGHGFEVFPSGRNWWDMTQKMAYVMAESFDKALGGTSEEFTYGIEDAAKTFHFSGDANPTSKTSCLKALQMCFDAILPDVRANSHDVTYIKASMTKNGGVGVIDYASAYKMAEYVTEAMHLRLTKEEGKRRYHVSAAM